MDPSDQKIVLDERSIYDHCVDFYRNKLKNWLADAGGREKLEAVAAGIRAAGKGKEYDSILGLSGGIDSSCMLHFVVFATKVPQSQEGKSFLNRYQVSRRFRIAVSWAGLSS